MRLLTHNFLRSTVKGTEKGYPLHIVATSVEYEESPYDPEFIESLRPKIDYMALCQAVKDISSLSATVPQSSSSSSNPQPLPELPEELRDCDAAALHTMLLDVHVIEGDLVCPDTGRKFPVKEGIPNMILHEDEL
mmetsp:Transcript_53873/g.65033  ORF Transcript_53873/g.65033 Transcript_53873/m.65033 type:complete len:135 (-) Transcript_53873:192-596(-)